MDLPKPAPFSTSRAASATFPLSHGSTTAGVRDEPTEQSSAGLHDGRTHFHASHGFNGQDSSTDHPSDIPRHRPPPRPLIELGFDAARPRRHKHSKSRELRLPRPMSNLASSASARGLLPAWSGGKEKDREGDDGLLRPITRETTRSHWGSDSTSGLGTGSRKGSLLDTPEQHERLGPIRRQEIRSLADLEQVKKRRKQGEETLRSALSSLGTLATDVTRRLDYTYYNLLEKITALNSTITLFQELSDSASTLLTDFERETAGLDQEIRKQINDLKGFEPHREKADALEARMKLGKQRVEGLGHRLEAVGHEIDSWERRETEWQTRISRRLRIFWTFVTGTLLVLVLAVVVQNWPAIRSFPDSDLVGRTAGSPSDVWESILGLNHHDAEAGSSQYPSSLADRWASLERAQPSSTLDETGASAVPTEHDPLRVFDEL
ncbi:hypothetical protein NUU61_007591 [Penicillium alfredii]|uniref:Uncharacterized protein n=1 Tax=Penicillium alfredii TaxID=1506179 RepID=A0A9W9EQZ1_9EURO|nr:uncharacterized protein NUU61_007591 [Penicillium alfredii]KAJ5086284.1 hypothetical protein NUU61_007591 [Penicillium alfredii]